MELDLESPSPRQFLLVRCWGTLMRLCFEHEKKGLRPPISGRMQVFREFVHDAGLMDLTMWDVNLLGAITEVGSRRQRKKIDRILVNCAWRGLYPNAEVVAIPPTSSDYSPIIMNINPGGGSRRDFRFEAFWVDHKDCSKVIDDSWNVQVEENVQWKKVLKKSSNCRRALSSWSKKTFRKADKDVAKLNPN
ncbi:Endonuclease/exonuclease/phosphatase superfamily [Sesbania bispinosa]|nr:Endonuclease/exonuclease/phosphatase superfamily [Sesbania bispinosa]